MKNIGIWLDTKKAHIVTVNNDKTEMKTILSNVENYNIHGGSGTKIKGGPQDVVQDSKYLEREKHQLKSYFKKIVEKIKSADAILIFGPSTTAKKLKKELGKNYKDLDAKIKAVIKADSLTDNQIKAVVRDFFKK